MHVLVIPSWYPTSYDDVMGVFFKEQAEALVKFGHKVGVIAIQDIGFRNIIRSLKLDISYSFFIENGVLTHRKQFLDFIRIPFITNIIKKFFFKRIYKKYIKMHGIPEIVHLHSFLAGDFVLYINQRNNVPFVVTEHLSGIGRNLFSEKQLEIANNIYKKSVCNISVSEKQATFLSSKFKIKFIYIPNCISTDFFCNNEFVHKKEFNFLNIAHLDKNKNQFMLIKAFYKAFSKNPHITLTIVGSGAEYNNLSKLISDLKIENQIFLYGRASRNEVLNLLKHSDAFVLSSIYETFGVVLIEAIACGLPVLSTKSGGPESIIKSDRYGILCEINEKEFTQQLVNLYENRFKFNKDEIRNYAVEHFSENAVCSKLTKIYERVIQ